MAVIRGLYFVLLLLAPTLLALTSASSVSEQDRTFYSGPYVKIKNIHSSNVVAIAKFAVKEHNKEKGTKLKYVDIFNGETQLVIGIGKGYNYILGITTDDGNKYEAIVYKRIHHHTKTLTSFDKLSR